MRAIIFLTAAALLIGANISAVAAPSDPGTYADAEKAWEQFKDKDEYKSYLSDFIQYNNSLHLDERNGCYPLGGGTVRLMIVITHFEGEQYAVIEHVFSDVDTAKATCFKKTYNYLQTKVPPFVPFVVQMDMG